MKCLLNNLCSKDATRYLELGTYRGSTLISALYGNLKSHAVGVDDFSYDFREPKKIAPDDNGWSNVKSGLYDILKKYELIDDIPSKNLKIIESKFEDISWSSQPKVDLIFCDPPYFLSNGGITCKNGKMVKVDKGEWDKSKGAEENHNFNYEWIKRCQNLFTK